MLLHESFESHAATRPYAVALTVGERHLTYGDLNTLANQFAHALIGAGVVAEVRVGLHLPPGVELIAAMLGIMKAGGAYVPLSPDLPSNRLGQILELAEPAVIVTQRTAVANLPGHAAQLIYADSDLTRAFCSDDPHTPVASDDLCYVIFTSGSTGTPKGVMVTYGNLVPLFDDIGTRLDIDAGDVWTLFHSLSFGFSVWEIWGALRHGGRLVIVPPELRTDPARLFALLCSQCVTMLSQTPSAFRQNLLSASFADGIAATALRCVVLSGEAVDTEALHRWFRQHGDVEPRIVNTYAITETAGQLTFAVCENADRNAGMTAVVGRPLAHAELVIVNEAGADQAWLPVPTGQAGELLVGGPSVARGYIGAAEQTSRRFIAMGIDGYQATRWYRTGDRARLTSEGELEFLGRSDEQVKLRGYRIELGEIAAVLRQHPAIDAAAVALRSDHGGQPRLVGYIVPRAGLSPEPATRPEFWPSVGPYQLYDEFLYDLMSSEAERLASYREAFDRSVRGKVVLDIGTGEHALLARMCIDAGARKVYAVEILEEAYRKARTLINDQGLADRIIVMQGDMVSIDLPEPVDVCTQGIIGNIGSADGIVPIWNAARRHFAPDCIPVPARCRTLIAAVELPAALSADPAFSDVAGRYAERVFDRFGRRFDIRLCVSDLPETAIISAAHVFEDLDFTSKLAAASQGSARMKIAREARLDGYLVWTVVTTGGDTDVDYRRTQQAWLPVFFPLGETGDCFGVPVHEGDTIKVEWSIGVAGDHATTGQASIYPDYRIVTSVASDDERRTSYEYLSRVEETALDSTPLYRALWQASADNPDSRDLAPAVLHHWLAARLPEYMLPTAWLELERLPLTSNHKLDRQALPAPEPGRDFAVPGEPARDDLERDLVTLWKNILHVDNIGIRDNFFDLGGDSISAVRLTSALQRLLDDAVMLIALFDAPTVAGLGEYLREHHGAAIAVRYSVETPVIDGVETGTVPDDGDAPLSFQQQSFWVLNQLYPSMTGSNEQFVIPLDGPVDIGRLEKAWNAVLERHEVLRTVFRETDSGVRQVVLPHRNVSLPVSVIDKTDVEDKGAGRFMAAAQAAIGTSYDLTAGPLINACLYRFSAQHAKLLVNAHHIIADGLSIRIIRDELVRRYDLSAQSETGQSLPPAMQYSDYSIRQRAESHGDGWERNLDFWRVALKDAPDRTTLPSRPVIVSDDQWQGHQARIGFVIDAATADSLRALSRRSSATLFMTLLAAFRVLLIRYSGQNDIAIGSPVTSRDTAMTQDMVGCLVNNVMFRNRVADDEPFADVLERERISALAALQHAGIPFERVVEALHPRRRFGEHPLFQILFLFEDAFVRSRQGGELRFGLETLNTSRSSYWDIEFSVSDFGDDGIIRGYLGYSTARFDDAFAESLPGHYARLLGEIVSNPGTPVGSLGLLESGQRSKILVDWNATQRHYPGPARLHERFAQQVKRSPDALALIGDDQSLSYGELASRVQRLAGKLHGHGIGPGDLVGIGVRRSVELVVGIIATLRTGAAYVPLDPNYPSLRLQFIVAQTGLQMILTDGCLPRSVSGTLDTIRLDEMDWSQTNTDIVLPDVEGDGKNAAYILYTSGSTGTPKGAIGLHAGAINRCEWMWHEYGFTVDDVFCLRTSPCFVDSVWEIFGPLIHGAALRVIADADIKDPLRLVERLAEQVAGKTVSHIVVVPSLLVALLDIDARLGRRLPGLHTWITSGEPLRPELLRRFRRACPGMTLLNTYGMSEIWDVTCFDTSLWDEDETIVPIGKPIDNVRTYVLDTLLQPVPIGVVGELYVGGAGLGGGYLQQPELNAKQFVPDPFSVAGNGPGNSGQLYRTGDLARYRADGFLECLGRVDRQIKLRGFRIEPDEIAAVMRDHPGVSDACVDLRLRCGSESLLVGYWQSTDAGFADNGITPAEALRGFLRTRLPDYMLPGMLIEVGQMPLTSSGKIDMQALPNPESADTDEQQQPVAFVSPGTETEHAVAVLWREILGVNRVGLHDDFFDSGGHSLSATRLLARIRAHFDIDLNLAQFFDAPTTVGVARYIDEHLQHQADLANADGGTEAIKLGRLERGDRLPLSFAQERLWFLNELDPDSPVYNIAFTLRLSGDLDLDVLQSAVDLLVQRHEVLRTRFLSSDGRPYQEVLPERPVPICSEDLSGCDARGWEQRLTELSAQSFVLDHGPLLRLHVLQGDPQKFLLLVVIHHIVSDGLSNAIFIDELATLYGCVADGREPVLPALPIQYADFSLWQHHAVKRPELDAQLDYWIEQLRDVPPALELPTDRPRPAEQMFRGAWLWRELSGERAEMLRVFGRRHRCTLFMVLLGTFDVLLSRYSGQTDIVVGSPIAGRSWYELDGLIGLFVNTVALRTDLTDNPTFGTLLSRVRRTILDSQANQDLPFERLVESLRPDRTLSHAPVFQVMFNMTPIPDRTRNVAGVRMRTGRLQDHGVSTFDLTLNVGERTDGLDFVFEYDRDLFDRQTIERIATYFDYLLKVIIDAADTPVSALPLWPPDEHAVLLDVLNSPAARFSNLQSDGMQTEQVQSVLALFESWVDRQPALLAVECGHDRLTYAELDRQANCVADRLYGLDIEPGAYVAVCLDRSVNLLVAVLGVLKAGCAYVPLDADYPAARLADMFAVVGPRALIAQATTASALSFVSVPTILLDEDYGGLAGAGLSRQVYQPQLADPAYALFTSGSTGTPKAVAVTHGNLAAICCAWQDAYTLSADDRHLQMASFSFDVFTGDWIRALCSGASLVLCPRFDLLEPARLYALLRDRHITCAEFVPAVLRGLLAWLEESGADLAFMRLLAVGSDSWYGSEFAALTAVVGPHTRVVNSYGTAETTIDSTFFEALGDMKKYVMIEGCMPIGRPFAGSRVYVCDPELRLVPPGVPGELCIGGAGVATGYVGDPVLTAERFVTDPFVPDGRLYRTGDRVRYHSDGTLVLLGRMDRQVKLRGFRIELGDIEAALSCQPSIVAAAVVIDSVARDRRLVAYVVTASGSINVDALRVALRSQLPDYMVPVQFVELDALPVTPNGKVDRNRLPVPEQYLRHVSTHVEPTGPVEAVLLELYRDVLGITDIGVHDSFFDRGGHSLLATQLVSRIRDVLNIELPLRALFEDPTITGLVAAIGRQLGRAPPPLRPVQRNASGTAPVSLMQQRLWFLAMLEPDNPAYHLHWSVRLTGALDRPALSQAVDALVARHDSLRTTIAVPESSPAAEPLQHIAASMPVSVEYCGSSWRLEDLIALPFDLRSGPLLRVHLIECGPDQHILLLVIHHIIADGWSMSVLFDELSQAYNAARRGELPGWAAPGAAGLPVQYADYAVWQREQLTGAELARQSDYWCNQLAGAPELLELPIDRPRPALQTHAGAWFELSVPGGLTAALHAVGRSENCTLFMVLMAAFDIALARFAGATDVVVATPIAGRSRTELEGLIGFFVNTLVMRTSVDGNPTFRELLGRVKQTALDAYAHQDLPFEKLVEILRPRRSRSYNPIVQVLFAVHNQPVNPFTPDGLEVESINVSSNTTKFDLSVHVAERDGELQCGFGYNPDLFDTATVAAFAHYYETILTAVSRDVGIRLSRVGTIPASIAQPDWTGHLVERFAAQVQRAPQAIAVRTTDAMLSYAALNAQANGVAQQLLSILLSPDAESPRIGLLCGYDQRLVAGLFGILKAGCIWVPLDPAWPAARLKSIAADAGLAAVVTDPLHRQQAEGLCGSLVDITECAVASDPEVSIAADALACIIYTSGSTGTPKGVMQTHSGVVIQVGRYSRALRLASSDRLSGLSGYAYDAAIQDIFGALLNGATLCPLAVRGSDQHLFEQSAVLEQLASVSTTVMHATPSLFRYLFSDHDNGENTRDLSSIRTVVLGGEPVRRSDFELYQQYFARGTQFVNGFGLTESTVALQFMADHDTPLHGQQIPLGMPVAGLEVDLIDESGTSSWYGEIVLSGTGLSPGYWGQTTLNTQGSGSRSSFLTGDIAYRRPDGQMIFAGRRDAQINVRGYRVELAEIEATLCALSGVADSAARIWQRDDDTWLAAYIVPAPGVELQAGNLRAALAERLPAYMLPQSFDCLEVLPRLTSGKLARHELPAPLRTPVAESAAARTALEVELVSIWGDLLQRETLGVNDDFFALGGHSLLATRVIARIRDQLDLEIPLAGLFDAPTVAGLAELIESIRQDHQEPALTRIPRHNRRSS
ncbi:MAG TPA: amino acid adenylation domain-containing protein [Gammaproteobacteria bacterium]|nr:hypothetical protein [Chromatiales bacterium]HJP37733.1 amino acid adenylation domain-containing protein [Gammaproteobacteria bacterium]